MLLAQLKAYIKWCKVNHLTPNVYVNLKKYLLKQAGTEA